MSEGLRSDSGYDAHRRNLQRRASEAHEEWLSKMSPSERRKAAQLGVAAPPDDDCEVGGHSPYSTADIADSPLARTESDIADSIDTEPETLADRFGLSLTQAEAILEWHSLAVKSAIQRDLANQLQLIVGGLLSTRNAKLAAAGLAFAADLAALNGLGCQREYAKQLKLSPQAVSKVVRAWKELLNLPTSVHQKSPEACATYSRVARESHWRKRKAKGLSSTTHASDLLARLQKKSQSN